MKNFKAEEYPENIAVVLQGMQQYVQEIDRQLNATEPYYIKDYISFGKKNRINRAMFAHFGFNSYLQLGKKSLNSKESNEIKGLYALAELREGKPVVINVGISQTIIRRFYQHTCGKKHNQSTLGFYMALNKHAQSGQQHTGKREHFPYDGYRDECLNDIRNLRFAIIPIDNNFELYMAEVYLACYYKAYWNTFETH